MISTFLWGTDSVVSLTYFLSKASLLLLPRFNHSSSHEHLKKKSIFLIWQHYAINSFLHLWIKHSKRGLHLWVLLITKTLCNKLGSFTYYLNMSVSLAFQEWTKKKGSWGPLGRNGAISPHHPLLINFKVKLKGAMERWNGNETLGACSIFVSWT